MSTPIITNPTTFTVIDSNAVADNVTAFDVLLGRTSGQYTLKAPIPIANVTFDGTSKYTGKIADLHLQLAAGQWFADVSAINANGESLPSPGEATFQIVPPPPSQPEGFEVA